jgi:hypothetical protein
MTMRSQVLILRRLQRTGWGLPRMDAVAVAASRRMLDTPVAASIQPGAARLASWRAAAAIAAAG